MNQVSFNEIEFEHWSPLVFSVKFLNFTSQWLSLLIYICFTQNYSKIYSVFIRLNFVRKFWLMKELFFSVFSHFWKTTTTKTPAPGLLIDLYFNNQHKILIHWHRQMICFTWSQIFTAFLSNSEIRIGF